MVTSPNRTDFQNRSTAGKLCSSGFGVSKIGKLDSTQVNTTGVVAAFY